MPQPLAPQYTIRYKTYLKRALVDAMRHSLNFHPDPLLKDSKVTIEYPVTKAEYPSIIVRFWERDITSAGVGHVEWMQGLAPGQPDSWTRMQHMLYHGTVEFDVRALSSYDRDLVSDSLVETLTMGKTSDWANGFLQRIYGSLSDDDAYSLYHYVNVNTDSLQAFGENTQQAPWLAEDAFVYTVAYRTEVFGELYSVPPDEAYSLIENVNVYPYIEDLEPRPDGAADPAPWLSEGDEQGS